ncbi:hypothetical protein [Methanobrevibacter filiformis]|uniref:Uncharacterized protein n=1 Tax=Methanobrevibacter filiformis TaxID=55758 RepID=A0A166F573_9EURY|nr:hypothetical protein [Methanobrevibacter filiformis]KZX17326.1 hypothetical protein MBFIL_02280 [Methanobrevibacter filiformis]
MNYKKIIIIFLTIILISSAISTTFAAEDDSNNTTNNNSVNNTTNNNSINNINNNSVNNITNNSTANDINNTTNKNNTTSSQVLGDEVVTKDKGYMSGSGNSIIKENNTNVHYYTSCIEEKNDVFYYDVFTTHANITVREGLIDWIVNNYEKFVSNGYYFSKYDIWNFSENKNLSFVTYPDKYKVNVTLNATPKTYSLQFINGSWYNVSSWTERYVEWTFRSSGDGYSSNYKPGTQQDLLHYIPKLNTVNKTAYEKIENETKNETVENITVINKTVENVTVVNKTVENVTVVNKTVENVTVVNKTIVNKIVKNITQPPKVIAGSVPMKKTALPLHLIIIIVITMLVGLKAKKRD